MLTTFFNVIIIFENGQTLIHKWAGLKQNNVNRKILNSYRKIIKNYQKEMQKLTKTVQKQQKSIDNYSGILYYYTEKHKTYSILGKVLYNTGRLVLSLPFVVFVDFFRKS